MTTIAWDDNVIAFDSRATISGTCYNVSKYELGEHFGRRYIAIVAGDHPNGMRLQDWYRAGPTPKNYPQEHVDKENRFARLVVANKDGVVWYEGSPYPAKTIDRYMAWGSGMDFALGAFYQGAGAIEAVAAAAAFDEGTGGPIIAYNYRTMERIQ